MNMFKYTQHVMDYKNNFFIDCYVRIYLEEINL